jgi:hypothetical protein
LVQFGETVESFDPTTDVTPYIRDVRTSPPPNANAAQ